MPLTTREPGQFRLGKPSYWDKPADLAGELGRPYWLDPLHGGPGAILGADAIRFYCSLFGMIREYRDEYCRTASYTLTLGEAAQVAGGRVDLNEANPKLRIPAGASATLVPAEVLVVPHYLIARIGLTVGLVQRGLLLGAGTQVDPGYQGALSCPVHNLSGSDLELECGRRLLRVDFVRTTGLAIESRELLMELDTEEELYARSGELRGLAGSSVPLFPQERRWRHPLEHD